VEGRNLLYAYPQVKFGLLGSKMLDELLAVDYKEHQPSVVRGVDEVRDFDFKLLQQI
jgi:hypothetical protein